MSTELKITKEAVLAAAAKCSTAKATLETLFPEVFEPMRLRSEDLQLESFGLTHKTKGGYLLDWSVKGRDYIELRQPDRYSYHIDNDRLYITPKK